MSGEIRSAISGMDRQERQGFIAELREWRRAIRGLRRRPSVRRKQHQ